MQTYWAFVRTGVGAFITVTVQAPSQYVAQQMLESTYGSNLSSQAALYN